MRRTLITVAILFWVLSGFTRGVCQEFSGPEQQAMEDTLQYALEQNQTNQGAEWVNPDSGRSGVVAPTRTYNNSQGQPCREFIKTITIGGKEEQGYGTACRQPDGSWQIVTPAQQSNVAPPRTPKVYVHTPAERYYAYPEVYSSFPIYLNFGFVYRYGKIHRGDYHMSGRDFRYRYPGRFNQRVIVVPPHYEPYRRHDGAKYREKYRYRQEWGDHSKRGPGKGWKSWDRD